MVNPRTDYAKIGNLEEARTTHISPVSCLILYYIITTPSLYRLTEIAPSTTYPEQGDIQNNMSGKCYQNFQDTFSRQPCGTYIIYYCTPASYSRNSISGYYRRVATVAVYFMFLLWTALFRSPLKSRIVPHWNILPPARPSPLCFVRSYRKHLMVQIVPGILLTRGLVNKLSFVRPHQ